MKIVHVEDFFHPDAGYQLNILPKYLQQFGHEQTILTAEMDKIPEQLTSFFGKENIPASDAAYTRRYGVKIVRLPLKGFVSGRAIFTRALYKAVEAEQPDVLFVHGNDSFTGIQLLYHHKRFHCAVVTDSHMLAMASRNRFSRYFRTFYKRIITPLLVKYKIPVIRTQNDNYVQDALGIPLSQAPWISYGSDTLLFHPDEKIKRAMRQENGIPDNAFVIVYAGKLEEAKGAMLLAQGVEKKFRSKVPVVVLVVGKTVGEYGAEVEAIFRRSENQVLRFPTQKYENLNRFFQCADLAVFPKQCSLSFYDAQACGLPVLSEDNNINVDRNSHGNGLCFAGGSVEDFRQKIQQILDLPEDVYRQMSQRAYEFIRQDYDYEQKAREYEQILTEAWERYAAGKKEK